MTRPDLIDVAGARVGLSPKQLAWLRSLFSPPPPRQRTRSDGTAAHRARNRSAGIREPRGRQR